MKKNTIMMLLIIVCNFTLIAQNKTLFENYSFQKSQKVFGIQNKSLNNYIEKLDSSITTILNIVDIKKYYTYYSNGIIESQRIFKWDNAVNDFYEKDNYLYNQTGDILQIISYNSDYTSGNKSIYNYGLNGVSEKLIYYLYDYNTQDWRYSNKIIFEYNSSGLFSLEKSYYYDGANWIITDSLVYFYNTSEKDTLEIKYKSDNNGLSWNYYLKNTLDYNANNKIIQRILYVWDINHWRENSKYETIYDTSGRWEEAFHFLWIDSISQWENNQKDIFSYTGQNLTKDSIYLWEDSIWVNEAIDTYNYDINVNMSDIAYILDYVEEFLENANKLISYERDAWAEVLNQFWPYEIIEYYYSNSNFTNNENLQTDVLKIYPNPTNGIITINVKNLQRIEIFDSNGKVVYQTNRIKKNIDISGQAKGIYFIKVITAKGVETKKILIE